MAVLEKPRCLLYTVWTKFTMEGKYKTTLFITINGNIFFQLELVSKKFIPFDTGIQKSSCVSQLGKALACKFIAVPNQ